MGEQHPRRRATRVLIVETRSPARVAAATAATGQKTCTAIWTFLVTARVTAPLKLRGAHRRKVYGALLLAVTAVTSLFLLAFNPLVVLHQRLLPQLFGIGLFRIRQRARRRSVPTGQAFKEGAQALYAESVQRVRLRGTRPPWPSLVLLSWK
jgi:hypothetical protein